MGYIDGWVPRFAFFVPIVGYLIIFNDYVGGNIAFQNLLGPENRDFPLDSQSRLRLVYFGLIFLGMSNIVFRLRQPHIFRLGKDRMQVTRMCLDIFTYGDFLNLHGSIRHEGHRTLDGKYYDSEWKGFVEAALNEGEGTDHVRRTGDWDKAKKQYTIFGYKGKQVRDNIHSQDVAAFIARFIDSPREAAVYNIGGGKANSCSILEAFDMVAQATGIPMDFIYSDTARAGDHICYYSDLRKMQAEYPGWKPEVSLAETIAQIAAAT